MVDADKSFWKNVWRSTSERPLIGIDAPTWANDRDREIARLIEPNVPPNGTIAEVGCGSARLLVRLGHARRDAKLVAIDYESTALELAQKNAAQYGLSLACVLNDATHLTASNDSYDTVISGGLLEHFPDPSIPVAEMVRTLKPGGFFYAGVVPKKFSLHRPFQRVDGPPVYRSVFGPETYEAILRDLGMSDICCVVRGFYPPRFHRWSPGPRRFVELLFRPFEGTWIANRLGYYFTVTARKPR